MVVKSKMNEEDFKKFLFYNQYYAERYYLIIQIIVSIIIGVISAYFSSDKLSTFVIITIACIIVFMAFPRLKIKSNYKKIYRRNRSTALIVLSVALVFSFTFSVNAESTDETANIDYDKNYIVSCNDKIDNKKVLYEDSDDDFTYVLSGKDLKKAIYNGIVIDYEEDQKAVLFMDSDQKWDLNMINYETSEYTGTLGEGIVVGLLDSGVEVTHEDLGNNILPGYNVFDDSTDIKDNIGHGTSVAGMIVGLLNGKGINGVAPKAKILPIKCFDSRKDTLSSTLVKAIRVAVDTYNCDVINMSAGIEVGSKELKEAVNYAISKGVVIVAAAGNEYDKYDKNNPDPIPKNNVEFYPACYKGVISVSSVNSSGVIATSSQRNEYVTVAAPGDTVYTTKINNSYGTRSGTSFATPIVTGIVADMLSIKKDLSNEEVIRILTETATDAGDVGFDKCYGYGIVNLDKCIKALIDYKCAIALERPENNESMKISVMNVSNNNIEGRLLVCSYNEKNQLIGVNVHDLSIKSDNRINYNVSLSFGEIRCFLLSKNIKPETEFHVYSKINEKKD